MLRETKRFEFGPYVLDSRERMLLRDGTSIAVPPKILELLLVLVENHGHLVEKRTLMEKLWPDIFVEESNLTFSIRKLRKILGDETQNPVFIETIPKRGYRFIASVNVVESTAPYAREMVGEIRRNDQPGDIDQQQPRAKSDVGKYQYALWGGISFVLIFGLLAFMWWLSAKDPSSPSRIRLERLTSVGKTKLASVSPDGKFVSYIVDNEGEQSIWLKNAAAGSDVQILSPASEVPLHSMTFSPDGNYIYYAAKDTLYRLPILGGVPQQVLQGFVTGSQFSPVTFSPDGKQFAFLRRQPTGESSLVIMNADGSDERILASREREKRFLRSAVWSPDGRSIALIAAGKPKIALVNIVDGTISPIPSPPWTVVSQIAWRADGRALFVVANDDAGFASQIWLLSHPEGKAENITNDLNNYQSISVTADGQTLAAVRVEQVAHIWQFSMQDGSQPRQLTYGVDGYDGIYGLDYLSNGEIAYESILGKKGQISATDPASRSSRVILNDSGSASVSPDGKYVAFQSKDDTGIEGLFKFELEGGVKTRLTSGKDVWVTYSPDAKWVVFSRLEENADLWKTPIDGGEVTKLTSISGFAQSPAVSPDGKFIAFHWIKPAAQYHEIGIIPFEAGDALKSFTLASSRPHGFAKDPVQWSPDSQAIDYVALRGEACNIWRQPLDGSQPFQITNFTDQQIFNFAYSPDGKNVALSRGSYTRDVVLLKFDR
jgi:Tol biopolymer transport system component/DNA-binding winged helix-turn-helix (wHTH) protein